jgi:hypothetical protein
MTHFRALMLGKAFKVIPGMAYNQTLAEWSSREAGPAVLFYELVMPEEGPWEMFRDKIYPTFARYLKHKSSDPENPRNVIVAVFFKDQCYLLEGPQFVSVLREMEGLDAAALHIRVLEWLSP